MTETEMQRARVVMERIRAVAVDVYVRAYPIVRIIAG
jgi:hypothetical protein